MASRPWQVGLALGLFTARVEPSLGLAAAAAALGLAAFVRKRGTTPERRSVREPPPLSPEPSAVDENPIGIPRHPSRSGAAPPRPWTRSRAAADLEARLAAALEAVEFVQTLEAEIAGEGLAAIPPENPSVPGGMPSTPDDLRREAVFEEAAVTAAYLALRGEIADRLEALQQKEGRVHDRAHALAAEHDAITAFRAQVAESIEVLRRHQARLEEIRQSLASWHEPHTE